MILVYISEWKADCVHGSTWALVKVTNACCSSLAVRFSNAFIFITENYFSDNWKINVHILYIIYYICKYLCVYPYICIHSQTTMALELWDVIYTFIKYFIMNVTYYQCCEESWSLLVKEVQRQRQLHSMVSFWMSPKDQTFWYPHSDTGMLTDNTFNAILLDDYHGVSYSHQHKRFYQQPCPSHHQLCQYWPDAWPSHGAVMDM